MHTDNVLLPSVLSGSVSRSSSGDRRVPLVEEIVSGVDMAA